MENLKDNSGLEILQGLEGFAQDLLRLRDFHQVLMEGLIKGRDYGEYQGSRAILLKPGAEKISLILGLTSQYIILDRLEDYQGGFFAYSLSCSLFKNGEKLAEGLGACNSKEKSYMASGDSYLLSNTCLKMAKKRALVDAVLTVAGLSHIFSQDMETVPDGMAKEEDMVLDFGRYRGKSLKELLDLDRAYVYWLRDQAMDSDLRQLCARLLERKGEVSGD